MHMKRTRTIRSFAVNGAVLILFAWAHSAVAAVIVIYPSAGNHIHQAYDPAGSGTTPAPDSKVTLAPDPIVNSAEFFLMDGVSQSIKDELANASAEVDFTDWVFNYDGASLNGTFTVDRYRARYLSAHVGGGEIEVRYKRGVGDPTNLRWIQLVTDNRPFDPDGPGPMGVYTPPLIDGDFDAQPFYWLDTEIGDQSGGARDWGFGTDYDLHFYDWSRRPHETPVPPEFDPIIWRAELYLTSWDGDKTVTFHEGINWGWNMTPVPEPSSLAVFSAGLLLVGIYRKRTRRCP